MEPIGDRGDKGEKKKTKNTSNTFLGTWKNNKMLPTRTQFRAMR